MSQITIYSLLITGLGVIILFFAGVKSAAKKKYKALFITIGVILVLIGGYGIITHLIGHMGN